MHAVRRHFGLLGHYDGNRYVPCACNDISHFARARYKGSRAADVIESAQCIFFSLLLPHALHSFWCNLRYL